MTEPEYRVEPTDDGGAMVVDGNGVVIATITPEKSSLVTPELFDRAMRSLDAGFDREEWGHG